MNLLLRFSLFTVLTFCGGCQYLYGQSISLAGEWRFAMDKEDKGITEEWFQKKLTGTIQLPGTMTTNNLGEDVSLNTQWTASIYDSSFFFQPRLAAYRTKENLKIPFWLTPQKYYVGAAWYQKDFVIPDSWNEKQIQFFIERTHIASRIWVDGKPVDSLQNSLSVPHVYDITAFAKPGKHTLTVCIDNRLSNADVGKDSHSVSDHTQGNWNGMIGKLEIKANPSFHISDLQVYPDPVKREVRVRAELRNSGTSAISSPVTIYIGDTHRMLVKPDPKSVELPAGQRIWHEQLISVGNKLSNWSEFRPTTYTVRVEIAGYSKEISFGMRSIKADGKKILVNDEPVFFRGDLNNCEFPLTGHPPMDVKSWLNVFTALKQSGLNHVRFHSWCPPNAAFTAADQLGIYLQPEAPTWPNHGVSVGDGRFIDQYIYEETNRMVKAYGNHPSFVMLAAGNEPAGKNQAKYLADFVQYWKEKDNRRIYTGASVAMSWPLVPENEYMVKSGARGLNWSSSPPSSMDDYNKNIESYPVPFITHEQGQWCVFPDFSEIPSYQGAYKARNFELFREDMQQQGLLPLAKDFLLASGKLQALCYKMEIERSLRTKDLSGFQLLGLQDFPGQGTALVGILNAFYKEKGYITKEQFSRFCNATVPLLKIPKFTWFTNEKLEADALLFHYGEKDLDQLIMHWELLDAGSRLVRSGEFHRKYVKSASTTLLAKLQLSLSSIKAPGQFTMRLFVPGTKISNDWKIWVYPAVSEKLNTGNVWVTDTLDAKAGEVLSKGGKVFLNLFGKVRKGKEIIQSFTPVFWNTSWFKMRPPHTLGLLIDSSSKVFEQFPTSYHSDLQWWEIVNKAQVMHLEDFPKDIKPLVRNIDTWFMNRNIATLFEVNAGKGKLIVCSADLYSDPVSKPVAYQLFRSILNYMNSPAFQPQTTVSLQQIKELVTTDSKFVFDPFTKDSPDELKPIKTTKPGN